MDAPGTRSPQGTPSYTHSLRLTFTYRGTDVRLARVQRVAMRAPAAAAPSPDPSAAGFWIEVRDSSDKALYNQVLQDPMRADIEVFGETPDEPMHRVPNDTPAGEFDVVVPDLPSASQLTLSGSLPTGRKRGIASKEMLRFDFDQLRLGRVDGPQERGRS